MNTELLNDDLDLSALLSDLDTTPEPAPETVVEAVKAPATGIVKEAPVVNLEVEHVPGDLREMIEAVTTEDKTTMSVAVQSEFDRRLAFELSKNPNNEAMKTNLAGYAKKMTTLPLAGVLCATDIDPGFLNREISVGKRFNVYAIDKVNMLLALLETGHCNNGIVNAVTRSLFKFRAAGIPFTGEAMGAAISDKVKIDKAIEKLLIRHTVSAATAPTQASQMGNALETLGIVVNRGTRKFPVWALTDTPQTRRLEEVLAA